MRRVRVPGDHPGESLEEERNLGRLVHEHAERGELLANLTLVLAVVVVVAALVLPGPSGLASGRGAVVRRVAYADKVLAVLLVPSPRWCWCRWC